MVKHTQTIRRQIADELFEFDSFVKLALKELTDATFFLPSLKTFFQNHLFPYLWC